MKVKLALLLTLIFVISTITVVLADVRVKGYYRKDGTYVQAHYRSSPDGNPYNNWSYPGNTNPYTGKVASGNPATYLKSYYNYKPTPSYQKSFSGRHWVRPYSYWRNGKLIQVPGHWRTNPNSIGEDNYNCPGNWNPNKGIITPGNREEWLRKYYGRDSSYSQEHYTKLGPQKTYSKGPTLACGSPGQYRIRGRACLRNGEFDLAIEYFSQAAILNPKSPHAYHERGMAHDKLGKLDEAIADYTQALSIYPGLAHAYYSRALAYLQLDKKEEALQDLDFAQRFFWNEEDKEKAKEFIQVINSQN